MVGFKRNRPSAKQPLNGSTTNSDAMAAARLTFKKQVSNASLATAAAGTALHSRPTTPTSVADVQTKRTMRRAASVSSQGSAAVMPTGRPASGLERRGSAGSMSERTFRDPSPARLQSTPHNAPPVPAIPRALQQQPPIPQKSHRRAASLESPAMRIASPPPNMPNGRGSSLGLVAQSSSPRRQRNSSLASLQDIERPGSRGGPPRITSPANQNLVYDSNTRSFLPQSEIDAIEQRIYDVANKAIPKKERIAPKQATGTHLVAGTVNGRPRGTAIDAIEIAESAPSNPVELPAVVPDTRSEPAAHGIPIISPARRKKKKRVVTSDSESDGGSYVPNSSDNDSDYPARSQHFNTRTGALLAKKPSVVREDRRREEEEDDTPTRPKMQNGLKIDDSPGDRAVSPTPLPRSIAGKDHGRSQEPLFVVSAHEQQQASVASQPPQHSTDAPPSSGSGIGLGTKDSIRGGRIASLSPARTHFGAVTSDELTVKHQPLGRSISPRKSAMKNSNSPRSQSPVAIIGASGHMLEPSEGTTLSNVSTIGSDDLTVPRKKANRVSFDDSKGVMAGEAAALTASDSPITSNSQPRKWLGISIGSRKKKDMPIEDDEVMQPRPALPSFKTLREKKPTREAEERLLVKPTDSDEQKSFEGIPLSTSPPGEPIQNPPGQSNDHAVGSVLAHDAATRNAANISKSREPLPPQVTSVEGNGDLSDSDSSSLGVDQTSSESQVHTSMTTPLNEKAITASELENEDEEGSRTPTGLQDVTRGNGNIPKIAVSHPTPILGASDNRREWLNVPGSWGGSSASDSDDSEIDVLPTRKLVEHHVTDPKPSDLGIAEPDPIAYVTGAPAVGEIAAENSIAQSIFEEPESEADSIYSDAAEDLSDLEGDGFMSLDAVVESPVPKTTLPVLDRSRNVTPESPTPKSTKERAFKKSLLSGTDNEPQVDEGWDRVQLYWSTLSVDRKKELEREAKAALEESSDTETETKIVPKVKQIKKAPLKSTMKQKTAPTPVSTQASERNYMIQPGVKAGPSGQPLTMRSSMRSERPNSPEETHIRKSMRDPVGKRSSLRTSAEMEPKGALQKKHRPISLPVNEVYADPIAVQNHVRALAAASAAQAQRVAAQDIAQPLPSLRRKGSGDSQSSFKRARPFSETTHFRRSMRGSSEQEVRERPTSPIQSSRFSLRSISPGGQALRKSFSSTAAPPIPTVNSTHMRMSMRGSRDTAPSLRNNNTSKLGTTSKSSNKPAPKTAKSSRFADSSDEDEVRPIQRSRFVDSSDEDEPAPRSSTMRSSLRSAPVRGIPKRSGIEDGDSSDLSDTDDEAKTPASPGFKFGRQRNKKTIGVTNGNTTQGTTLASGSLRRSGSGRDTLANTTVTTPTRPDNKRRGSFMSSILRRKKTDPESKVRKTDIESAARRDTPLERSRSELEVVRGTEKPTSPKLQKRNTMSRENSASWPLTPTAGLNRTENGLVEIGLGAKVGEGSDGVDGRPRTADTMAGLNGNVDETEERPDLGKRRFTATGVGRVDVDLAGKGDDVGGDVNGTLTMVKKKKKFGRLRRVFGFDD